MLLILFGALLALGIGGQKPKRARRLRRRLATEQAPTTPELRALLDDGTARALNYLSALLLIAIPLRKRAQASRLGATPVPRLAAKPNRRVVERRQSREGQRGEHQCEVADGHVVPAGIAEQVDDDSREPERDQVGAVARLQ